MYNLYERSYPARAASRNGSAVVFSTHLIAPDHEVGSIVERQFRAVRLMSSIGAATRALL
jgi:hypothetical protein